MSTSGGGGGLSLGLLTAAEMREWDRRAIEELAIPERVLMESAGRAAARRLHRLFPRGAVAAAVGRGNNGGDAVVMLRALRAWGREVVAVPASGEGLPAALAHGWEIPTLGRDRAEDAFTRAAVVVDGLLGTGASGVPREPIAGLVRAMNDSGRPVVALDGPTGVDLTDGSAPGEAVRAAVTLTFGAPKRGHLLFPGRTHAGRLLVLEVGFPPLLAGEASAGTITRGWAAARLPGIAPDAHKFEVGEVAVLAGRRGMGGAALLVAGGALRSGAGLVRVITAEANRVPLHSAVPEALFVDLASLVPGEALSRASALVAGPAMGTDAEARDLLAAVVRVRDLPVLLDADALTLLAAEPDLLGAADGRRLLLTPHPGELGRLLGERPGAIAADPFGAVERAVERFGCAVLLKGAPSLVGAPGEPTLAALAGHSGVATGGMGDTLAGVAGTLLAAGAEPRNAAAIALHLAGRAAEISGLGRSLLPRDVVDALPRAIAELETPAPATGEVLLDLPPAR